MSTRVKLGDVCQIKWGDTSKTKAAYTEEGYPAFSASGRDGYMPHFDHEGPGIVLSAIGAQCGKTWFTDGKWSCIKNTISIRPKPELVDGRYIYYQTRTPDLWPIRGAAQPFISQTDARAVEIDLPDLPTQRRIAGILSAYDDLIENNLRRIRILEEMAQSLYREWFVHFRFPGHESVPLVDSPLGPIPEGWEVKPLFDVATVKYGKMLPKKDLKPDGEYPVYGAAKVIGHYDRFTREDRTIICGCRGSVGEMQITEPRCYVTNNSFTFDPVAPELYFWLFYALAERGLRDVTGGAAQPQITLDGISQVTLATPGAEVLKAFEARARGLANLRWNLENRNQNLRKTRDLLLPKLLSPEAANE